MWKRILLGAAALLVVGIGTLIALLLSISAGWQRGVLVAQVESALADALDARVTIDSISGPLYPEAVLHDVEIERDDGGKLGLVRARARVRLEVPEWRRPKLVIETLDVHQAKLHVARDPEQRWSFQSLFEDAAEPSEDPSGFEVEVDVRRIFLDGARVEATWNDQRAALEADLLLQELDLNAEPPRGRWELLGARVDGDALVASATGEGDFETIQSLLVDADLQDLAALAALLPGVELAGRASLRLNVSGPIDAPRGEAELSASELVAQGVPLGELRTRLQAALDRNVSVQTLSLDGPRLKAQADGPLRFRVTDDGAQIEQLRLVTSQGATLELRGFVGAERVAELELRASALDLRALAALLDTESTLSGRLDADLVLDGPLPLPRVRGTGTWQQPVLQGVRLESVGFEGKSDDQTLRATLDARLPEAAGTASFELVAGLTKLEGGLANVLAAPDTRLRARSRGIDLKPFRPLLPEDLRSLDGRLAFDLDVKGAKPEPRANGSLRLSDGSLSPAGLAALEGVTADVRVQDTRTLQVTALSLRHTGLEVQLAEAATVRVRDDATLVENVKIASNAGEIDFAGTVRTRGPPTLHDARLRVRALDVARLETALRGASELAGTVSGDLVLEGPLVLPRVAGELEWIEPGTAGVDVPDDVRPERIVARIAHENAALTIDARVLGVQQQELLLASARLPWHPDRFDPARWLTLPQTTIHAEARGLRLETFAPFMPRALRRPGGAIDASIDVRGGSPAPEATGEVVLSDASVGIRALGARLENIDGRFVLDGDVLRVERLRAGSEEHGATLQGRIDLVGLRPGNTDLKLVFDHFAVPGRRLLEARVNGSVELGGPPDSLVLTSQLALEAARIRLPRARDPLLTEIRVAGLREVRGGTGLIENGNGEPGPYEKASMDLALHVPPNTWIEGSGVTAEVTGDLILRKKPLEDPVYLGALRVVRGTYELHGKRFEVQQGVAGFTGSSELDPQVHLVALHRVRDTSVVATISGFLSDPSIELAANPSANQDDILALLLFGRPVNELRGGQAANVQGAAAAVAGRLAADRLQGILQRVLPIDQLDFDPGSTDSAPRVGVGRYIGEDVFVHYGQGLGGEQRDERVRVEWRLNENWSLEGEAGTDETGGADLFWRYDY